MAERQPSPWEKELDDYLRAFSGAFVFGVPLLFTMEMWWIGMFAEMWKLLLFLGLALLVNTYLAYYAGFKRETTFGASVTQAIEAVAVGVVASLLVLLVLNRIQWGDPLNGILGKIIIQTVPLSIGASAANFIFARVASREIAGNNGNGGAEASSSGSERKSKEQNNENNALRATLNDVVATVAGGIFIGFTVAPTEEIPMLAAEMKHVHELVLIGFSLLLTYVIVFESGFDPQERSQSHGPFQHPFTETALAYVVSLAVALASLFLFDQIEVGDSLSSIISQTLVLGLPTAIGGAAGRIVI